MKKIVVLLLTLALSATALTGCSPAGASGDAEQSSGGQTYVTIATGGSSGAYYALGGTVANLLNENIENMNASVQSTGASAVNSTLISQGKAELAFAMNDVVNYAYTGTETFSDKEAMDNIRGVAALYPNFVQLITLENTGVTEVADLSGKRVGVGAPGSGTEVNARQILAAHGMTYDDVDEDFLSYAEAVEQLKNGAVDAAFLTSGIPNSAIMDLATTKDVKIVPIRKEAVEGLGKDYPFYTSEVIPAGTYDNTEDVETAAVTTLLITSADLSEEMVYEMTKTIFENLESLGQTHSSGKKISLDKIRIGMPIPLHAGAEKYFAEQGK
jgi:TRAP transporter TAXI family solute receptor